MRLQDLKDGKEFKVGSETFLKFYKLEDNTYCITQFGGHRASIRSMNEEEISIYTYFFGKIVEAVIKMSEVEDMDTYLLNIKKEQEERDKIKEAEMQELQDEYGIGAYEE